MDGPRLSIIHVSCLLVEASQKFHIDIYDKKRRPNTVPDYDIVDDFDYFLILSNKIRGFYYFSITNIIIYSGNVSI